MGAVANNKLSYVTSLQLNAVLGNTVAVCLSSVKEGPCLYRSNKVEDIPRDTLHFHSFTISSKIGGRVELKPIPAELLPWREAWENVAIKIFAALAALGWTS